MSPHGKTWKQDIEESIKHKTVLMEINQNYCQAMCECGWISSISYFEEVDLLRAMHVHLHVAFKKNSGI